MTTPIIRLYLLFLCTLLAACAQVKTSTNSNNDLLALCAGPVVRQCFDGTPCFDFRLASIQTEASGDLHITTISENFDDTTPLWFREDFPEYHKDMLVPLRIQIDATLSELTARAETGEQGNTWLALSCVSDALCLALRRPIAEETALPEARFPCADAQAAATYLQSLGTGP